MFLVFGSYDLDRNAVGLVLSADTPLPSQGMAVAGALLALGCLCVGFVQVRLRHARASASYEALGRMAGAEDGEELQDMHAGSGSDGEEGNV